MPDYTKAASIGNVTNYWVPYNCVLICRQVGQYFTSSFSCGGYYYSMTRGDYYGVYNEAAITFLVKKGDIITLTNWQYIAIVPLQN